MSENYTMGVEEEFCIVDGTTGELKPRAGPVLNEVPPAIAEDVQAELNLSQAETGTKVCRTLDEVRTDVIRLRRALAGAAEAAGCRVATVGTHPRARWQDQWLNRAKDRYRYLEEQFALTAREQLVNGCHVHVGFTDRDLAIAVLDRARVWMSPLLALSANSPYWGGVDSGYASYRTQVWSQWPQSGLPEPLDSRSAYDRLIADLQRAEVLADASFLYWDIRPSSRYETLEFRIADSCLTVDETVMVAGLVRAVARTAAAEAEAGTAVPVVRSALLRGAKWKAARFGLQGDLVDVTRGQSAPAPEIVGRLLDTLRPALEEFGDWETVRALVEETLRRGNGAQRQRAAFARRENLDDVVELILAETADG